MKFYAVLLGLIGVVMPLSGVSGMEKFPMSKDVYQADYRTAAEELLFNLNVLHQAGYEFEEFPEDVLSIYYNDFIIFELIDNEAANFQEIHLPLHPLTQRDILNGLTRIGADKFKKIFERFFVELQVGHSTAIDELIREAKETENVQELNAQLLWSSDQIAWKSDSDVNAELAELAVAKMQEPN